MQLTKSIFGLVLLILVCAACSATLLPTNTATSSSSPTLSSTATPNPTATIPATSTALVVIQPTATVTLRSTLTPSPVDTSTPMPPPTEVIPQETMAVLTTLDALVTEKPVLGRYYSWNCVLYPCYVKGLGLSPDGKWAVFFNFKESGGLSIVNVETKAQWDIYFDELTGWTCPCGDARIDIVRWSRDGQYLYLSPNDAGDGGYDFFWNSRSHLFRLNLGNGSWADTKMGSAYSFSPDEKYLAYRLGQVLVIHKFLNGADYMFTVPKELTAFGRFVWSPEGDQVIFVASVDEEDIDGGYIGFTIFIASLANMDLKLVLEHDPRYLYPLDWPEPNIVVLKSMVDDQKYQLNLETNEIILIK